MILLAAAFTLLQMPRIVEAPDPSADRVALVAVIPKPICDDEEETHWRMLAEALPLGTLRYSAPALRQGAVSTWLGADHLGVRISVPAGSEAVGCDMLAELLGCPLFPEEETKRLLEEAPFRVEDPWVAGLRGRRLSQRPLAYDAFRKFAARVLRPESIRVMGTGKFVADSLNGLIEPRWDFQALPTGKAPLYSRERRFAAPNQLTYGLLEGKERPASELSRLLLVAYALGVGKGAPLFQVWREEKRLSYRQELFVEPTPKGFRLRAMVAQLPREDSGELAKVMKSSLSAAVERLSEADLARAKSVAELSLELGLVYVPLYLAADEVLLANTEGDAALGALGLLKQGKPFFRKDLLREIRQVDLKGLKEEAASWVESSMEEVRGGS